MKDENDNKTIDWVAEPKPRLIQTELGTEKLCLCCEDYYPMDDEFFYPKRRKTASGVKYEYEAVCKACYPTHYNKQTSGRYKAKSKHEMAA